MALRHAIIQEMKMGGGVLFACFIGVGAGFSSLNYYTAGIFMAALESEFGWSRGVISSQALIGVAGLVLLSPVVGVLIDRVGTRIVASVSLVLYGMSFLLFSHFLTSIPTFIAITLFAAVGAAGSTPITFTRAITGWFDQGRGIALGLALVGAGLAGFLAPLLLAPYVAENGWRAGAQFLAFIVAMSGILVATLLKDRAPAPDVGNRPSVTPAASASGWTVLRTPVLLLLGSIFFLIAIAVSGLIVHFIPMLIDTGLSLKEAGKFASVIGLSVIIGRLLIGALIDHFFAPYIAFAVLIIASVALAMFALWGQEFAFLAAIAVGLSMGAEVDLIAFLTSRYFDLDIYGKVYGILYAVFVLGSALSPVIMGVMFDQTGSYDGALMISVIALIVAAGSLLFLPTYERAHP